MMRMLAAASTSSVRTVAAAVPPCLDAQVSETKAGWSKLVETRLDVTTTVSLLFVPEGVCVMMTRNSRDWEAPTATMGATNDGVEDVGLLIVIPVVGPAI